MPVFNQKTRESESMEVRALFNAKANTWNQKYVAGGPLAFRVAAFESLLKKRLSPNAKILDLGCGTGAISSSLAANGFRVTACDISEEMIEAGEKIHGVAAIDWRLLPADWEQLPFEAGTFDAVFASSVLEYVQAVNGFLSECRRVLKSDGILIATVPDVRALTRKLESLVRPAAMVLDELAWWRRIPRLHSYATYLKCSCNRMSLDQWRAIGERAHFSSVDRVETDARKASLVFLEFRKR